MNSKRKTKDKLILFYFFFFFIKENENCIIKKEKYITVYVPPPWRNGLACWTSNSKVVGSSPTGGEFLFFIYFSFIVLIDYLFVLLTTRMVDFIGVSLESFGNAATGISREI